MGIYTDYGRFMKAREFKNWCNSGAGIWFGFGIGSPRWDQFITPDGSNNSRPFVPPSQPAAYTPLYRWYRQYKADSAGSSDPSEFDLQPQEMELMDRSFGTDEAPSGSSLTPPCYPDNQQIKDDPSCPINDLAPSINRVNFTEENADSSYWEGLSNPTRDYPSASIPPFPIGYKKDWDIFVGDYFAQGGSGFNPDVEPTDESEYESFAYAYHVYQGLTPDSGDNNIIIRNLPLGLLSFIQGSALFVEPIAERDLNLDSPSDSLKVFKYGSHYWRIVQDNQVNRDKLPHFVLLTVSVFPNELALSSLVENQLPVRQVSVYKFPDSLVSVLGLGGTTISRSSQVLRRERINIVTKDPASGEDSYKFSVDNPNNIVNIPIHCQNPLTPNDSGNETAEMLINDFMTARKKDVQQTDRYGYIIGF